MKKIILLYSLMMLITGAYVANAQQKLKDGTVASTPFPNTDAILDLESMNKGLLMPRVALVAATNPAPLSAHVKGIVVYNTAHVADVDSGLYYNDGTQWAKLVTVNNAATVTTRGSFLFYDDTTNISVAGIGTSPNGTSYVGFTSYGRPVGSYIAPASSSNIDSIKKVGIGVYKIFFHPGMMPDNNYSVALTSSDGLNVSGDDGWQVCNAPYTTRGGSTLFNACAREAEPLIPANGGTPPHYITRTKNYCYIITTYGGAYDAAYVSVIFFR